MEEECCLCMHPFDDVLHVPLILGHCGHTFCKECLREIEPVMPNPLHRVYLCPICKKANVSSIHNREGEDFARNYTLLGMITKRNKGADCTHEHKDFFCLDNGCQNGAMACLKCVGKLHSKCSDVNIRRSTDTKFVADFDARSDIPFCNRDGLKELVNEGVNRIGELLDKYTDKFAQSVAKKCRFFEEVARNPASVVQNKKDFELLEVEPNKFKIHLRQERLEALKIAIKDFWTFFETSIFESLAAAADKLLAEHHETMHRHFGDDFDLKLRFPNGKAPSANMMDLFKDVVENPGHYSLYRATGEILRQSGPNRPRPQSRKEMLSFRLNPNDARLIDFSIDEMLMIYSNVESLRKSVSQVLQDRYQFINEVKLHFGDPHDLEHKRKPFFAKRLQTQDLWLVAQINGIEA